MFELASEERKTVSREEDAAALATDVSTPLISDKQTHTSIYMSTAGTASPTTAGGSILRHRDARASSLKNSSSNSDHLHMHDSTDHKSKSSDLKDSRDTDAERKLFAQMPYFGYKDDLHYIKFLVSSMSDQSEYHFLSNPDDKNNDPVFIDLSDGLRVAAHRFDTNKRPLLIVLMNALLCVPGMLTNSAFAMIPSLLIALVWTVLTLTCWKKRFNTMRTETERCQELKIQFEEERESMAKEKDRFKMSVQQLASSANKMEQTRSQTKKYIEICNDKLDKLSPDDEEYHKIKKAKDNFEESLEQLELQQSKLQLPHFDNQVKRQEERFEDFQAQLQRNQDITSRMENSWGDFDNWGCRLLGIRKRQTRAIIVDEEHVDFSIVPSNICYYLILGGLAVAVSIMLAQIQFFGESSVWTEMCSGSKYLNDEYVNNGSCLVQHSVFSFVSLYFVYSFGMAIFLYQSPTMDAIKVAVKIRKSLENAHDACRVLLQKIENTQEETTKNARKTLSITNVINLCLAIFISFAAMYSSDSEMFWKIGPKWRGLSLFIYFYTRLFCVFAWFRILADLWNVNDLFERDQLAMTRIAGSAYFVKNESVRLWYRMRQYFLNYVLPLGSAGPGMLALGFLLLTGLVCSAFGFVQIVFIDQNFSWVSQNPDGVQILFGVVVIVFFMLRIIYTAVSTTDAQVSHLQVLKYEIVRLKAISGALQVKIHFLEAKIEQMQLEDASNKVEQNECKICKIKLLSRKYVYDEAIETAQLISDYLEKYDDPVKIFGIPVTQAMLYTLYGYITTLVVTISSFDWFSFASSL